VSTIVKQADAMLLYEDNSLGEEDKLSATSIPHDKDELIHFISWMDSEFH
jgi:hypothetical protein